MLLLELSPSSQLGMATSAAVTAGDGGRRRRRNDGDGGGGATTEKATRGRTGRALVNGYARANLIHNSMPGTLTDVDGRCHVILTGGTERSVRVSIPAQTVISVFCELPSQNWWVSATETKTGGFPNILHQTGGFWLITQSRCTGVQLPIGASSPSSSAS